MPRQCSIICTIGPKTKSVEMITKLRECGMNIVRMKCARNNTPSVSYTHLTLPTILLV